MNMNRLAKLLCVALAMIFSLAGCTIVPERQDMAFVVDTIRDLPNCADEKDARYPCEGIGPEGFVRDLVAKPFTNRHAVDMYSDRNKAGNRMSMTWFFMQGSCHMGRIYDEKKALQPGVGRLPYIIEDADGALKRVSLELFGRVGVYIEPFPYLLGHCETGMDLSAGQPMLAELQLWGPGKFNSNDLTIPVVPSATGKFRTGCRVEKKNNLTWQVCSTAAQAFTMDKQGKKVTVEQQREVWITQLGKAGYFLRLTVTYSDPIFQYPLWYAERQANISDVIGAIRVEPLPYPPPDFKATSSPKRN